MIENFKNQHALIIGGSSGIGMKLAIDLSNSHSVTVLARRESRLKELSKQKNIFTVKADVTSFSELDNAVKKGVKENGKITKMIYCAGYQLIKPHRLINSEDVDLLYEINLRGAIFSSKIFCSNKISEKNSVFCAISSIAAVKPEPGIISYSVMKAGLDSLIKGLAKECGPRRFVAVSPGWLNTEMTQNQPLYNEAFIEELEKNSPLGLTKLEDVVQSIIYLIGDSSASITGQILCVDSGTSL